MSLDSLTESLSWGLHAVFGVSISGEAAILLFLQRTYWHSRVSFEPVYIRLMTLIILGNFIGIISYIFLILPQRTVDEITFSCKGYWILTSIGPYAEQAASLMLSIGLFMRLVLNRQEPGKVASRFILAVPIISAVVFTYLSMIGFDYNPETQSCSFEDLHAWTSLISSWTIVVLPFASLVFLTFVIAKMLREISLASSAFGDATVADTVNTLNKVSWRLALYPVLGWLTTVPLFGGQYFTSMDWIYWSVGNYFFYSGGWLNAMAFFVLDNTSRTLATKVLASLATETRTRHSVVQTLDWMLCHAVLRVNFYSVPQTAPNPECGITHTEGGGKLMPEGTSRGRTLATAGMQEGIVDAQT